MSPTVPAVGDGDAVVRQLGLLLADLLVERLQRASARRSCALRTVDLALADRAGARSSVLLRATAARANSTPIRATARVDSRARRGRLLRRRIDLEQHRARARRVWPERTAMRVRKPSTCGWIVRGAPRLQRADVFAGLLDRLLGEGDDLHRHRRRAAAWTARPAGRRTGAIAGVAIAGRGQRSKKSELRTGWGRDGA